MRALREALSNVGVRGRVRRNLERALRRRRTRCRACRDYAVAVAQHDGEADDAIDADMLGRADWQRGIADRMRGEWYHHQARDHGPDYAPGC